MTITFPRTDLYSLIDPEECRFRLPIRQEISRSAGGVTRVKELGDPLWTAEMASPPLPRDEAAVLAAWFDSLIGGARTYLAHDVRKPRPASDPTDAASLGSVQISSVTAGKVALKGLPAGFVVTAGDYLGFSFGATPSRALHRASETVTANGSGVTAAIEVRPPIRAGAVADTAVVLRSPVAEWMVDPGSLRVDTVSGLYTRFSWTATQVL